MKPGIIYTPYLFKERIIKHSTTQTLDTRISRMEKMCIRDIPVALKYDILKNIISLRIKKIIKDHCE